MFQALSHLRANREALLVADGTAFRLLQVLDAGRIVFPAAGAVLEAEDLTMFVPEEDPREGPELQLQLAAALLDDGDAACDRWRIYHGEPEENRWAAARVEGVRFDGQVEDAEALNEANPLAGSEPRLCKRLNTYRGTLGLLCRVVTGIVVADPVAVGVDPEGIDIRARFGIVRLPFREAGDAEKMIEQMLSGGKA